MVKSAIFMNVGPSDATRKFSVSLKTMLWVWKMFSKLREMQRTSNHVHPTHQSEYFLDLKFYPPYCGFSNNLSHLRLPGKEKVEDDVIINVERDMEKLKKLGPEDVEVEEDKARQSQQKTLAAAMRAEGLKERQRNPAGVSLMY